MEEEIKQMSNTIFDTREELLNKVKIFCFEKSYATAIKNSRKDKYIRIGCDRGGTYRKQDNTPLEFRKRNTSSRLINCPFQVLGKRQVGRWLLEVTNGSHNHEASSDMSGHPSCRHLSEKEMKSVEKLTNSGVPPRKIISSLRQKNPSLQAISKSIYNSIQKIQKYNLGDRTVIQALFEEFGQGKFIYNIKHDQNGCITHLFFAHPTSIILSRSFSNVFVMDCTYKTNKYKMPLLDIIGVSCFNSSFYSCFTFMERGREEGYVWALNMFRQVLGLDSQPSVIVSDRELALMNVIHVVFLNTVNLLCVWHIEKNILANCKRYFEANEEWNEFLASWNRVIQSSSDVGFNQNWKLFEELYNGKKEIIAYIIKTWFPFKERFVYAWTEKHQHFGNRVSSRAEGAHAKLKKYLQVSTGDFRQVKEKICLAIANEFQELKSQLSSERLRFPHNYNGPFFKELVTNVSMFAMKALYKQYKMNINETMDPICSNRFMSIMGLPCAHEIMKWRAGVLPISIIHSQWRICARSLTSIDRGMEVDENFNELFRELQDNFTKWHGLRKEMTLDTILKLVSTPNSLISEPIVVTKNSSSLKRQKGSSSTKRNPSQFEIEEKKTRKCSKCKSVGHDIQNCLNKSKVSVQSPISSSGVVDSEEVTRTLDLNIPYLNSITLLE